MVNILNNLINLFQTILIMSGCAALLCGVILLMKAVVGRRMSARSHALAWLVLIPALLVPFSLIFLPAGSWIAKSAEVWRSVRQPIWLILSLVWLTGLMIFLAIYFFSYQKACRMIRTAIYPTTAFWQERLKLLVVQVRLGKPEHVQLRQMDSNHGPFIIGLRRCYIVLPSSIFEQENNSLVDSILIHELIHIKHRDHWLHC